MRRIPLRKVGEALVAHVRSSAAEFSTELQRCQVGSRASFQRTAQQLLDSLPAVVATRADVELATSREVDSYLEQEHPWDLNLLTEIPESGEAELALLSDEEKLAELFSGHFQSLTLVDEPYLEFQSVQVVGVAVHTDLAELEEPIPIAWTRVRVLVRLTSWEP